MYDWPLNDAHLVLLVLACVSVIIIGSIVTSLTTVRRAEFSRLQNEVKQLSMMRKEVERLSKKIKALEVDEERRFLMELNPKRTGFASPLKKGLVHDTGRKRSPKAEGDANGLPATNTAELAVIKDAAVCGMNCAIPSAPLGLTTLALKRLSCQITRAKTSTGRAFSAAANSSARQMRRW